MKQQSSKKSKLWLWLVLALAVLVAAGGVLLAIVLPGQQSGPQGDGVNAELYWNIDRTKFIEEDTGLSTREKEADGLYHMLFAYKGQQVELTVADKQLVNIIDAMDVVGLVLDSDGQVIDAVDPKTVATEAFKEGFMHKIEDNTLYANSAQTMNGMAFAIPVTENTGIYDVSPDAQVCGADAQCELLDTITVYTDAEGNATHIYIVKHPVSADVYWRVGRYYDSENSCTTRVPDENGVYTILFAKDGEQVELKCRNKYFVDHIDSLSPLVCQQALVFDEEGYIIDNTDISMAVRGKYLCQYYTVTGIEGDQVTAERIQSGTEQGMVKTFTLGEDCDIFMCCSGCHSSHIGERTDHLRVGDTVNVYTDFDNNATLIFVSTRPVESGLYYNLEQKYNSVTKETRREPENGWYVYKMFCDGKTVTVKTQDKTVANAIDSTLVMGLELDGNVVLRAYPTRCVTGTNSTATNKYVTSISGTIFTAASATDLNNSVNAIMAPDCKIYDMTGDYGVEKGSLTTLKMYDRVFTYSDMYGLVSHIFVYSRYAPGTSVYYNVSRKYDSENQVTTREPDADGYYVYDMIANGKEVTVKTKSKSMASFIDAQSAPTVALKVSGGIIREAHLAHMAVKFGSRQDNYVYIDKVNSNRTYTTYYYSGEQKVYGTVARKMASNCAIYNVSLAYTDHRGEKTTLQPGDRIQSIVSAATGEAVMVFVMSRELDSPLYWHVKRSYNTTTGETRRKPDAEGWYVFDLAADGQIKQFKTKDKAIASEVDQFSGAFVLITDGDVILRACNATLHKQVKANAAGAYDVMAMNGNKITLTRNRPLATNYGDTKELTLAEGCKIYNVSSYAESFGAEVKLQLGDRVTCYSNDDGEVSFIFITNQNTRKAGHISYCDHCGEEVFWNPFTGELYETDAHYYLTNDTTASTCKNIGSTEKDYAICLDLNGKTLSSKSRAFLVYSTLSIMDSAGGGSVIGSGYKDITLGSCVLIANGGTLNLHGGTLTVNENAHVPGKGGVVNVGNGAAFNMYGGAVKGGHASNQGGNIFVNGSVFNLYGGTIEGGTADLAGGNLYTAAKSTVLLAGGAIAGDAVIGAGSTVTVSGDLVVTKGETAGLKLATGDKLTLGQLTEKASIVVSAEGVFTQVKDDISRYLSFFKPFYADDTIEIRDGALAYVKTPVDLNKVDNSNLRFQEGTTKAMCPVCKVPVTWIALGTARTNTTDGSHYYLAEDIVYDGDTNWHVTAPESGSACLHLNGHNLTSPTRAIQGNFGVLNVMGNGTVTGNYTDTANAHRGATVDTTPSKTDCAEITAINLIGGTYANAAGNTQQNIMSIWDNGGRVRVYSGATVNGGIYVGKSNILDSELAIHGGTVNGTVTLAGSSKNTCLLTLSGGTVEKILMPQNAQCLLSGAPVVNKLELVSGAKLTLGALTQGASLTVLTDGVFTQTLDNISDYLPFFLPFHADDTIEVRDGALACVKTLVDLNKVDNSNLSFQEGTTKAMCPVCKEEVTWTALTEKRTNMLMGDHYYLAGDVTYEGDTNWHVTAPESGSACLHLNGHILNSPTRAIQGNTGVLNVMGNGTVYGNYSDTANPHRGAAVDTTPSKAECADINAINLIGGTYMSAPNTTQTNTVSIWDNGGRVRIYAGATVSGSIYVGKSNILSSELAIHGGTVSGTVTMAGSDKNTALLTLAGGTTEKILMPQNAQCLVSGTPVVNKLELASGAKLTLGEVSEGARVVVSADGVFTQTAQNISQYLPYFLPYNANDIIEVQENALACVKAPVDLNKVDNSDLSFQDGTTKAMCPVCMEVVTWTALTEKRVNTVIGGHYYLAEDVTYEGGTNWYVTAPDSGSACLHLNGHKLTSPTRAIQGNFGVLNVMGNGTVTGNFSDPNNLHRGATVDTTPSKANCAEVTAINLLGGTYINAANSTQTNVISIWDNGGRVRIYAGATVSGGIYVGKSTILDSELAIHGGTVSGTVTMAGSDKNTALLNLAGGTVRCIQLPVNAQCTVSGAPVVTKLELVSGAKLTLGALTEGASLTVAADGVFTNPCDQASSYLGYFHASSDGDTITPVDNTLVYTKSLIDNNPYDGELNLDANGYAVCPVCNENVQWTDLNSLSDARFGFKNDKTSYDAGTTPSYHFYLSDDLAYTKNAQYAERYYNITCLHLNGHNLSYTTRMSIGVGATLNIMGTGSITGSCNSTNAAYNTSVLYTYNGGTINLYEGTYNCTNAAVPTALIGNKGTLTIMGGTSVGLINADTTGKLVVGADWSGTAKAGFTSQITDNLIPEANGVSLGAFTGQLTLNTSGRPLLVDQNGRLAVIGDLFEQELVLDANGYAQCPACNENVQWTDLNSLSDARFGFKNDKTSFEAGTTPSYHFYLSNDLAYTKNAQYAERYYNITCLHLNGHNLSYTSRMSIGVGATLNIMGTGSVTSSCNSTTAANNTSTLYTYNGGTINLYGGTVNCTNTEVPAVLIGSNAATQVNLYDGASVQGGLTANNGTVTVSGDSSVDALSIATPAKLVVSADWSGTATASFARQIVDGFVHQASGVSQGAFTGILNLTDGTPVTGKDGKLAVRSFDPSQDDGVLKILGIGNSYTMDSMHLLYDVYKAENPDKEVVLSFLYYGACSLQSHASFLADNSAVYTYYKLDGQIYADTGKWQQTKEVTMRMALLDEQWDIVTLQQYSAYSAKPATYDSSIGKIRDYVELTLGYKPEFAWNFTWGYPDDAQLLKLSSDTYAQEFFDTYGTTEAMYNQISAAVQEKIVNGSYSFDYLMSVGTAVQNARSNHLTAMDLYRDHTHLNNLGRIIAAYTWYCELEGYDGTTKPLTELKLKEVPASLALTTSVSNGVTQLDAQLEQIVLESINNALKNKFQVTNTQ